MSVARYSRDIDFADLNNVHTLAVLSVPTGSRVLDLGAAEGSVARALRERGCAVTAVERDADAVAVLRALGLETVPADLDGIEADAIPAAAFDVILLLDVLEHLVRPARLLTMASTWLAPGGRIVVSVPNVAHAAVRLALLQGTFPRSDVGLLDRTHLHFFDRAQLGALVADARLEVAAQFTVQRDVADTEVPIDLDAVAPEVLSALTSTPGALVYQYLLVVQPVGRRGAESPLAMTLQSALQAIERTYHSLETHATRVHAEMLAVQEHRDALVQDYHALEQHCRTLEEQQRALSQSLGDLEARRDNELAMAERLADTEADRDVLRAQLTARMAELTELAAAVGVLQQDLAVQRAFAEDLAAQVPRIAACGGEAQVLGELERFRAVSGTPERAAAAAADAAELRRLQGAAAIRTVARADAMLRRHPRLRHALRAIVRAIAGRS